MTSRNRSSKPPGVARPVPAVEVSVSENKPASAPADGDRASSDAEARLAALHRDVAFANTYRIELIKFLLGICAAIFAFMLAFRPTLETVQAPWSMWLGWLGLGGSMVGGMVHMIGWDHFYKSYRDHDHRGDKIGGKKTRRIVNFWRRLGMTAQYGGFAVGVAGVGLFAGLNLDNVRRPASESTASKCLAASAPSAASAASK